MKNYLFLLVSALCAALSASAQYVIYPVPQQMLPGAGSLPVGHSTYRAVIEAGIDDATRQRLASVMQEAGFAETADESLCDLTIYLGINGSDGAADKKVTALSLSRDVFAKAQKYDRHLLSISREGIVVVGENTDAAFFGLASLEQILGQRDEAGRLAFTTVYDWADQQSRGLVEGYYGYPYSIDVKKDLMRFMMRHKMNTYMYGAKSDPYHSQYWKDAYPTSITAEQREKGWLSQDMVREISATSAATKVNFIWAIHPGNSFVNSSTVVNDIMSKFEKMYQLGVRQFAVFVDDVGVPSSDADLKANADHLTALQHAIEAKWNVAGAQPVDTVKPLHFVPQIYCASFAPSVAVRQNFFRALGDTPSYITIYTTGNGVWSVPNNNDLLTVKNELGRSVAWWWNYPCNDNADQQIFPMNMYENFYDMPSVGNNATLPSALNNGMGIVSNPMQEGEVSKTPLFSVADYAWNNGAFNQLTSWEASFSHILKDPAIAQAYHELAPFIRWNDPQKMQTLCSTFKSSLNAGKTPSVELRAYVQAIYDNTRLMQTLKDSETESDRLLYLDLAPWLNKLESMTSSTLGLIDIATSKENDERWTNYLAQLPTVNGLDTDEAYKVTALEGMGNGVSVSTHNAKASQRYFRPFINDLKQLALKDYFTTSAEPTQAEGFTNVAGAKVTVSTTAKGVVNAVVSPAVTLPSGGYVGVKLAKPALLSAVAIADTLVANNPVLWSTTGKDWHRLTSGTEVPEEFVRYVVVLNDKETPKSIRLIYNSLRLTIPVKSSNSKTITIPSGGIYSNHTADYTIDGDYSTWTCLNRNQQSGDTYQVTLATAEPIYDVRICMGTVNQDYPTRALVQVSEDGTTWTSLKVKNGTVSYFDMNLPQVKRYSDEMSYLDFECNGLKAKHVRLYVNTPNTNKWLRLYEIEVNRTAYGRNFLHTVADKDGEPIAEATDGQADTRIASDLSTTFTYNFLQAHRVKEVVIYQDPNQLPTTAVEVTENNGTTWKKLCNLAGAKQVIDLSDTPAATALRFTWAKTAAAPAIYEIIEVPDTDNPLVVDGIRPVVLLPTPQGTYQTAPLFDLLGRRVYQPRHGEIYISNGKKILY